MSGQYDTETMPDGIEPRHLDPAHRRPARSGRMSWVRAVLLGAFLAAGLAGLLGGGQTTPVEARSAEAAMQVHLPTPIRNGMFVEWRIDVTARAPVSDAVIAVPARMWRDMTVNSLVPAASDEEYRDGEFRFHFGPLAPGQRLLFKIDGQINPPRLTTEGGAIRLLDGEREILSAPVTMKVLP